MLNILCKFERNLLRLRATLQLITLQLHLPRLLITLRLITLWPALQRLTFILDLDQRFGIYPSTCPTTLTTLTYYLPFNLPYDIDYKIENQESRIPGGPTENQEGKSRLDTWKEPSCSCWLFSLLLPAMAVWMYTLRCRYMVTKAQSKTYLDLHYFFYVTESWCI